MTPLVLPKKWIAKCAKENGQGPLTAQFIPDLKELDTDGYYDPIGDHEHQVVDGLIHRYQNRVLFLPTKVCPVACRYCFRKHEIENQQEQTLFTPDINKIIDYLKNHSEIQELIFSGGDPFSLSNSKINFYLEEFKKIPHLRWIRFHTRYPSMIPTRFKSDLLNILAKANQNFSQVSIVLHINHWSEWDEELKSTMEKLKATGCKLLSQSVLLKGINDQIDILTTLFTGLIEHSIQPYYLHHPDLIKGGQHFYISLNRGRELYHLLRDRLPGWAIPQYVIDIPGGHGKIPATNSDSQLFQGSLVDKNGIIHPYP
jgi:lysine 2,3-aminomutase